MRGILLDLDGVLYNSEDPIEGAAETIQWIKAADTPYLYVTNTTSRGRSALIEKFRRFGISADRGQILSPCVAAAEWLRARSDGKAAFFVRPKALEEFEGVPRIPEDAESGARYVVIGDLGDAWDFRTLNRAFRLLQSDPQSVLIALGMTRYWHAQDGLQLDVAPFVAALAHATGRGDGFRQARRRLFQDRRRKAAIASGRYCHDRRQHRNRCCRGPAGRHEGDPRPNRKIPAVRS